MNYYENHIGDYLKDTAHLSLLEHGVYKRLLDVYYTRETPLPEDVARLIGARSKDEKAALTSVLNEFFQKHPDGWHQGRCDAEIARYQDKQAKAKRSAEARWGASRPQSDGNANASADGMRTHSEGNAHQTPDTSNQTHVLNTSQTSSAHPPTTSPSVGSLPGIDEPPPDTGIPDCPHQRIRAMWAELLPELQQTVKWSDARAAVLRARWREEAIAHKWATEEDGLKFFAKLFRWCRRSPFLMGKVPARAPGATPFSLTLPWLTKAENWAKVQEGNFHPEG